MKQVECWLNTEVGVLSDGCDEKEIRDIELIFIRVV